MSQIFEASRLSSGNKLFPCKIEIDNSGMTATVPGLFKNKSETVTFSEIISIKIETPLVGFSKIIFDTTGFGRIIAEGFTKKQVLEIRELIQRAKATS